MKKKPTRKPRPRRLKSGLDEAVRSAKGELKVRAVQMPDPPPEMTADEVTSLRTENSMSQAVFARVLNVSTETVQGWEQGEQEPSDAARRLLQVFRVSPALVIGIAAGPRKARRGRRTSRL
jgi:putative transcriptional regulator